MLTNVDYYIRWQSKKADYASNGISEENGNLIVTIDSDDNGIDSTIIANIVKSISIRYQSGRRLQAR
jgi:hypothetical protein